MQWLRKAACAHEDPDLFFPVSTKGPALRDLNEAKRVCMRCPVIVECREWAIRTGQRSGVWGGLGEEERARLRRASPDTALGTP